MHIPRAAVAVLLVLVLLGPAATVHLLDGPGAHAAEDTRYHEFVVYEMERVDRGGRNRRESLGLYRYRDYEYLDERYTNLENWFHDTKEALGIHGLLERGFRLVDLEPAEPSNLYVVRIEAVTFEGLVARRR